jgi:hypothetical protein
MKYSLALISLLATSVFAIPSSRDRYNARVNRRSAARALKGQPMIKNTSPTTEISGGNETNTEYSQNWSGAVIESPPSGETWQTVTGTFTVPVPSGSSGAAASAWVGIDGDTCGTAILQTGVDFTVGSGYDAWYEWYPDYAYDFSGIDISAGDVITTTVTASSTKKGKAVIENTTTGQTVTKSLTSSSALCLENAEWIVEDFEEGSSLVPLADFGTVKFSSATATTSSGTSEGPSAGIIIDIKQGSTVYTSVSTGSNEVTIKYV